MNRSPTQTSPADAPAGEAQALYQSQKRQVIGALAGGIAHDFNNILTAVIGNLDLALMDEDLSPPVRQVLQHALASARRGAELNTKLLAFSRQTDARPAPVDVARLIEETVFILRRSVDPRIRINLTPPAAGLWSVLVDEGQFMQVLMNLCLNARDAMPEGGDITFTLANRTFNEAEAKPPRLGGEFLQVTVADTGAGMTSEVLERLFEPYFTTKEFGRGAGLGLSIANHVAVDNGGWMEVESQPGKGTQFHVYLPRTLQTAPAAVATPRPTTVPAMEGNETILLVDDEQPVRTVMNAVLSYRGYKVVEAENGNHAVEQFRSARDSIRLVLLDIRMPELNGWDTLKKIRELDPRMPVLMLSGGSMDTPDERKSLSGATGVLRKPFTGTEVLRTVREVLDEAKKNG